MTQNKEYALTFDFGGTKLAAAVVHIPDGQILAYHKTQTPNTGDVAENSLTRMFETAERSLTESGVPTDQFRGGGISFGGPVSLDGTTILRSMHIPGWENFPLAKIAADRFHMPFKIGNDGNVATLGEWFYGSHALPEFFLYVQISTGIGGGVLLHGKVYQGQGLAAEVGHVKVQLPGETAHPCACGSSGCIEAVASGWALARDARDLLARCEPDAIFANVCRELGEVSAKSLTEATRRGDRLAGEIIENAFSRFALAMADWLVLFDLEEIVIGGSVAVHNWDLLEPILTRDLPGFIQPELRGRVKVRKSALNGMETLLGAAQLTV